MESKLSSDPDIESLINTIDAEMRAAEDPAYYDLKPSSSAAYKALKKEPVERQTEIARYLFINRTRIMRKQTSTVNSYELAGRRRGFPVFQALMRGTLELPPEEVLGWAQTLQEECKRRSVKKTLGIWFSDWPIAGMVQQIERHARKNSLSDDVLKQLQAMLEWPEMQGAKSC